jgi:hypothetical protein
MRILFSLGQLLITPAAADELVADDVWAALARHGDGDWGDVDEHDRGVNEQSLNDGSRLLSVYSDRQDVKFWIITEADRSATTILLPSDY